MSGPTTNAFRPGVTSWSALLALFSLLHVEAARAHEGHAALPTKGATVQGERLMLSPSAAKAIGLATAKVSLTDLKRTVRGTASVELPWSQQAFVTTLVPGKIEKVLVKPGETVTAGQELAQVASLELESLQLAMLQVSSQLTLARRMLEQREALAAQQVIPAKNVLEARTEVEQRAASLYVLLQKLRAIGLSEDELQRIGDTGKPVSVISMYAPIGGIISDADVRVGQIVEPSEHLYHVVDDTRVWLVGKVLEADAGQITRGQTVQVTFDAFPGKTFTGKIDQVDLEIHAADRTLSVRIKQDNKAKLLKPGMFGRMQVEVERIVQAIVCPRIALIRDGQSVHVLVEQSPGNFVRRSVKVGRVHGQQAEILDGLFPGDRVVTVGSHELGALFGSSPSKLAVDRTGAGTKSRAQPAARSATRQAIIAQGRVELPTDRKGFASANIQGRVSRILVEYGQPVEKGQLLAEVESLEFKTLQLDLLQARVQLKQAKVSLARMEGLGEKQLVAQKELWRLRTEVETLTNTVTSVRRKLALAGLSENEIARIERVELSASGPITQLAAALPIRSPATGVVAGFNLVPGQVVKPDEQLFEVHDDSKVWIQAYLFEQEATRVRTGQRVTISVPYDATFEASGTVMRVSPVLSSSNRVFSIWTELANPDGQLKEGMSATVSIAADRQPASLAADPK